MSYSFSARGATKEEAAKNVAAELAKVVAAQPIHAVDQAQAQAAAEAFLALVPGADGKDFHVSVHGSVSYHGTQGGADQVVSSVSVGVGASLVAKEKPAA